jgi:threonine synthase
VQSGRVGDPEGDRPDRAAEPNTIAKSIAIGNPADGYYACQVVRNSGGWGESATDPEIVEAIKLLAQTEGIWTEPAGGTTLAATIKLINSGRIPKDESIVVSITGNGLKTQEVVKDELPYPVVIDPKLSEFDALLASQQKEQVNQGAPTSPAAQPRQIAAPV